MFGLENRPSTGQQADSPLIMHGSCYNRQHHPKQWLMDPSMCVRERNASKYLKSTASAMRGHTVNSSSKAARLVAGNQSKNSRVAPTYHATLRIMCDANQVPRTLLRDWVR
jgi:hypothetical protein